MGLQEGPDMRVLLIEDDSAMARSIELMLRSEGLNVYTTDLGEEGIDLGKLYDYDIIVLDLQLPDMSRLRSPESSARRQSADAGSDSCPAMPSSKPRLRRWASAPTIT